MKHPKHPRREPLDAILESAAIESEAILAKRLEAVYQRLLYQEVRPLFRVCMKIETG